MLELFAIISAAVLAMGWFPYCCDCFGGGGGGCGACPDDGPSTGFSFEFGGAANNENSPCNCENYNGTYSVPRTITTGCLGGVNFTSPCCFIGFSTYEWVSVSWYVDDDSPPAGNWKLVISFKVIRGSSCGVGSATWASATFELAKTSADNCADVSAELATLVGHSSFSLGGSDGCDLSGLSCSVSAY